MTQAHFKYGFEIDFQLKFIVRKQLYISMKITHGLLTRDRERRKHVCNAHGKSLHLTPFNHQHCRCCVRRRRCRRLTRKCISDDIFGI